MNFCATSARIWQLVGYALFVLKIVIPLIIIILGIIDFTKALTASKDDALNDAVKAVLIRFVIGIAIFFIPLIISTLFAFIKSASPFIAKAEGCEECLLKPFGDTCQAYKAEGENIRNTQKQQASKPNEDGYEVRTPGCYFCNSEYIWTDSAPSSCTRLSIETSTGKKFTKELCEAVNNDPDRKEHTSTAQKPPEEDDQNQGSSGTSGSSDKNYVFVGDSIMDGICSNNNLSKCFSCVGGGLDWLNGDTSRCQNNATNNVGNDVGEHYNGQGLNIVVYLGTNDVMAPAMPSEYYLKYDELLKGPWHYGNIIVIKLLPLKSETVSGYNINQTRVNNFNTEMEDIVKRANNSKVKYCDLGLSSGDLEYSDGLHFTASGYKKIYETIKSKCL